MLGLFGVAFVAALMRDDEPAKAKAIELSAPAPIAAAPIPKPPPHPYYTWHEGDQYGYQRELAQDDVAQGRATSPLFIVRTQLDHPAQYAFFSVDGGITTFFRCSEPCDVVKTNGSLGPRVLPVTEGSLIWAVVEDARHGYFPTRTGASKSGGSVDRVDGENAGASHDARVPIDADAAMALVDSPVHVAPTATASVPTAAEPANRIAPSFDCSKARSDSEKLICSDPELATQDTALLERFMATRDRVRATLAADQYSAFVAENKASWTKRESECHDKACLLGWYDWRGQQLDEWKKLASM